MSDIDLPVHAEGHLVERAVDCITACVFGTLGSRGLTWSYGHALPHLTVYRWIE